MWEPPADPAVQSNVLTRVSGVATGGFRGIANSREIPAPQTVAAWPGAKPLPRAEPSEPFRVHLATNLWDVYHASRTMAFLGRPLLRAVEIGNEPDLHFTPDLPDRMAATLKAAYWGVRARRDVRVLMPALCSRPGPYAELLVANGIGPFTDGWNFHFYGWAHDLGDNIAVHRQFLQDHGLAGLPLWLTEFGFAEFDARFPQLEAMQAQRQQAFFERAAAEIASSRVEQAWAFCLQPLVETGMDLGLHDANYKPRPALASLAKTLARLKSAVPRYRLRHRASRSLAGHAFESTSAEPGARWWVLLGTPHRRADFALPPLARPAGDAEPLPAPETSYFDFKLTFPGTTSVTLGLSGEQGRVRERELSFRASASTNLHLHTDVVPFPVEGCEWEAIQPKDSPRPVRNHPSPVVVTLEPDGGSAQPEKSTCAYRLAYSNRLEGSVTLWNFGAGVRRGRLRWELPSGWTWKGEAPASQRLEVQPGQPMSRDFSIECLLAQPWDRVELVAQWIDEEDGFRDVAQIRLAPGRETGPPVWLAPKDWQTAEPGTVWEASADASGTIYRLTSSRASGVPSLILPMPGVLTRSSVLRWDLQQVGEGPPFRLRVELITPGREVFRWGEEDWLGSDGRSLACRVADFTPAFWSRADRNAPEAGRYVRLSFPGMRVGDAVRFGPKS